MSVKALPIDKDAGKRFKLVRKHLKLGQQAMADECGVSQSLIAKIESGNTDIPPYILKTLFIKFKVNPNFIIIADGPIEYKKDEKNQLITNVRELRADLEVTKAQVRHLYSVINKSNK